jgi:serpin B
VRGLAESALATGGSGPLTITFACSVWHQEGFALKTAYRDAAVESYKAEARAVDFHVRTYVCKYYAAISTLIIMLL